MPATLAPRVFMGIPRAQPSTPLFEKEREPDEKALAIPWQSARVFGAVFIVVTIALVAKQPVERHNTGCELPGAIRGFEFAGDIWDCEQIMQRVDLYWDPPPLLRSLPPSGPTPEMKIKAIESRTMCRLGCKMS